MIVLDLFCGMGNQMFQYAYARQLQEIYGDKLYFTFITSKKMKDNRTFSLNHCNIKKDITAPWYPIQVVLDSYGKVLRLIFSGNFRGKEIWGIENYHKCIKHGLFMSSDVFLHYPLVSTSKKIKFINGFWQSEKYFMGISGKIKNELKIITPPSVENCLMLNKIKNSQSVCMHVRRGDYISDKFKKELEICNEDYYKQAMDIITSKVENPVFFVFSNSSDDIKWIKENYRFTYDVIYVDLNNPDYEEIRLMYSCKYFILANSTFSWWGAYLSDFNEKIVVAPSVWNRRKDLQYKDIYLNNWIIIDV